MSRDWTDRHREDVHCWFGLSYANYLALPRTLLQSMPGEWQHRFVACLAELNDAYAATDTASRYSVQARDDAGRFVRDPVPHYQRGRSYIEPAPVGSVYMPCISDGGAA